MPRYYYCTKCNVESYTPICVVCKIEVCKSHFCNTCKSESTTRVCKTCNHKTNRFCPACDNYTNDCKHNNFPKKYMGNYYCGVCCRAIDCKSHRYSVKSWSIDKQKYIVGPFFKGNLKEKLKKYKQKNKELKTIISEMEQNIKKLETEVTSLKSDKNRLLGECQVLNDSVQSYMSSVNTQHPKKGRPPGSRNKPKDRAYEIEPSMQYGTIESFF